MEKLEAALDLPGQPVKRGTMAHRHIIYMMLTEAAAQLREQAPLKKYAGLLEELASNDNHKPYLAVAHRAWGTAHRLAGEYDLAEERLREALVIFSGMDARWQIGRTQVEMAELELARASGDEAEAYFSQALESFEALQAQPDTSRTKAALAAIP